jgi:malonyl-CoA decarboxylase
VARPLLSLHVTVSSRSRGKSRTASRPARLPAPSSALSRPLSPAWLPATSLASTAPTAIKSCRALLSERGTVSGPCLAADAIAAYHGLDEFNRVAFFDFLVSLSSRLGDDVQQSAAAYASARTVENLIQLRGAVGSPCRELFLRLNTARGGTSALVDMRRFLLNGCRAHPDWGIVEADLAELLRTLFNPGLLELRPIDWRSPPHVLEYLIRHEAVHAVRDGRDMRRRLEADRRCFALYHPAMPDEPVAFTEIALTPGLVGDVQALLDPEAPVVDVASRRCATFYSISSCHDGLRGVPFGNILIRRALDVVTAELPQVGAFATVSPVPGFRAWAEALAERAARPGSLPEASPSAELERTLLPLCAWYLLHAKRGTEPADPVARFHLNNGARLERLNWRGDLSEAGLARSWGLTANYVYRLSDIERHHHAYAHAHHVVASAKVRGLASDAVAHLTAIPA